MLIGDKTGPAIIAHTYGDVRPDHLLKQAQRIRLTATQPSQESSNKSSNTSPDVTTGFTKFQHDMQTKETIENKGV